MTKHITSASALSLVGARIPVIAAPMAGGPSTPALVAAAAEAGGVGFLAGGYKAPAQLADQLVETRRITDSFGVNLFAPNPVSIEASVFRRYADALQELADSYGVDLGDAIPIEDDDAWSEKVDLLVRHPVPLVSFTFGLPSLDVVQRLHEAGSLLLQTVTTPHEARQAADLGVDALVVQGFGAGGHSGTLTPSKTVRDIPLTTLVAEVRAAVPELPVWAAGGLSTPEEVQSVHAAGAEASVVGTILLRSPESGASAAHKAGLADPGLTETVLTRAFSGRPARGLRNSFIDRFEAVAPLGYPAVHHLTSPLRKAAAAAGDTGTVNLWAGTGFRNTSDEPTATILRRLAGER